MVLASIWTFADFFGNLCESPSQVEHLAMVFAPVWAFLPLAVLYTALAYSEVQWPSKSWLAKGALFLPGIGSIVLVESGLLYASFHDVSQNGVYFWSQTTDWQWLVNFYFLTYLSSAALIVRRSGQVRRDPILRRTGRLMIVITFAGLIGGGLSAASATGVEPPFLASVGVSFIVVVATRGIFKHHFFTSVDAMRVERDAAVHTLTRRDEVLSSLSLGVAIARLDHNGTLDLVYQNLTFDRFFEGGSPDTLTSIFLPNGATAPRLFREVEHKGRHLSVQSYEISYDAEHAFLFSVDDLSEKKWLEAELAQKHAQLLQAQKMEAVGQLAAGITHDFNNQLQSISLLTELIVRQQDVSSAIRELAEEIISAIRRARGLTQQLLRFGRKQGHSPEKVDVREAISGLEKLLGHLLGSDIALELSFPEETLVITIDRIQFEQVMMTLATNSQDAMPEGGTFSIAVEPLGDQVCIRVSDSGIGIPQEVIGQVFDPFFTTKGLEGTGLGLAVSLRIVDQAQGVISVESSPGVETVFTLMFPRAESGETTSDAEVAPTDTAPTSLEQGTILVVDDQVPLLRGLVRVLESEGFRVFGASSGKEALEIAAVEEVDVLLTDLTMPGMGGVELAEALLAKAPELCVIYMTGYNAMTQALKEAGATVLIKPFDQDALVALIHHQRKQLTQDS